LKTFKTQCEAFPAQVHKLVCEHNGEYRLCRPIISRMQQYPVDDRKKHIANLYPFNNLYSRHFLFKFQGFFIQKSIFYSLGLRCCMLLTVVIFAKNESYAKLEIKNPFFSQNFSSMKFQTGVFELYLDFLSQLSKSVYHHKWLYRGSQN